MKSVRDVLYTTPTLSDVDIIINNLSKYDLIMVDVCNIATSTSYQASYTIPVYKNLRAWSTYEAGYVDIHYLEYSDDNILHIKTIKSPDRYKLLITKVVGIIKIK